MLKTSVTGEAMIFRKEFSDRTSYQTTLSHKKNGEWENGFIGIQFKKGVDIPNKTKITITHGWIDFYPKKDGSTEKYIFCNEFETERQDIPDGFYEDKQSGFAALDESLDDSPF
ncbi:MAG: hypothetical protein LLG05_18900 [Porphyromonadaceae bacterium]|nr:hypothetical protein [Porphyromonadaceae bacterium]